jgi:type IX secretion system substrate protein
MKKELFILIFLLNVSVYSSGQITFQKVFGASGYSGGYDVQQTSDGGYIITGSYEILGVGFKGYLIKTDAYGDTLWTKIGTGGGAVQQTTDGGYICLGGTLSKRDNNGNLLWSKTYSSASYYSYGAGSVQQTTDGGYILAGVAQSTVSNNTADVALFKTDSSGNWLWSKTYGGANGDVSYSVQQTTDGGYIIAGSTSSFGAGQSDVYLIKTDTIGNLVWSKTFGGTGEDVAYCVQQTTDGGYIIAGGTFPFVYLIKTDANGDSLWTKAMGNPTSYGARCVQQTTDGGYIITGDGYIGIGPTGSHQAILIKTDANGDLLWIKAFGGTMHELGFAVKQTADGGYIITGSAVAFAIPFPKVYLIKTDSMGNSGCNQVNDFIMVNTTTTQVTSPATIVTAPSINVSNPVITDSSGGYVTTVCINIGINELTRDNYFLISPNPSDGNFTISFESTIMGGKIEIINTLGIPINIGIAENISNESKKEINLKNVSEGIYIVKVFDGKKNFCKKFIVE